MRKDAKIQEYEQSERSNDINNVQFKNLQMERNKLKEENLALKHETSENNIQAMKVSKDLMIKFIKESIENN